jgi:hypothetical protein
MTPRPLRPVRQLYGCVRTARIGRVPGSLDHGVARFFITVSESGWLRDALLNAMGVVGALWVHCAQNVFSGARMRVGALWVHAQCECVPTRGRGTDGAWDVLADV